MEIIIIGAGGHGRVVLDILRTAGIHKPIGFLDADPSLSGQTIDGLPVLGPVNHLHKLKSQKVKGAIVAIGDNQARLRYAKLVLDQGLELVNAIHPTAVISKTANVGRNVVVAAGAVVGTAAKIADSVIVNTSAVIDHECEIESGAHICPSSALAGRVRIGEASFVGLGCRIIQCLKIGAGCVIGAGAVVIRDVEDGATVVGVPARVLEVAER